METGGSGGQYFSIHAPLARSDLSSAQNHGSTDIFNPRSSCEERRQARGFYVSIKIFNPRSSCGRPLYFDCSVRNRKIFNPRSSCEERRHVHPDRCATPIFNPRSSCEERQAMDWAEENLSGFQSRSSCERRGIYGHNAGHKCLSIHAPLARSDVNISFLLWQCLGFQSTLLFARSDNQRAMMIWT